MIEIGSDSSIPVAADGSPSHRGGEDAEFLHIGGIRIVRLNRHELAMQMARDVILARSGQLARPRIVTSANGSVIAAYHAQPEFRTLIDQADLIDADGMPLVFASRIFCKKPLTERTSTTDFVLDASEVAEREGIRFFFLGARAGVAARAAEHLRSRYRNLQIVGTRHGYFSEAQLPDILKRIRAVGTDILWLGMGSPLQERLAIRIRDELPGVAWVRTCGGLFDHYGGGVSRAPDWMQASGLEWMYRAAREPVRLGWRYLVTSPVALYYLATKTRD